MIYGSLFVLANILPDLVDFGILSIKMGSLSPREIMTHELFHALAVLGHTFLNWVILAVFVLLVVGLLFVLDKISKKVFYGTIVGVILVLIGIAIHLGLDVLIQESSHWI